MAARRMTGTWLYIYDFVINTLGAFVVCFQEKPESKERAVPTWGVQVVRYPNFFFSGMEAGRNVKVVGGDVAVLQVGRGQVATLYYPLNACDEVELQQCF